MTYYAVMIRHTGETLKPKSIQAKDRHTCLKQSIGYATIEVSRGRSGRWIEIHVIHRRTNESVSSARVYLKKGDAC